MLEWRLGQSKKTEKVKDPIAQTISNSIEASCTIIVVSGGKQWTGSGFHVGHGLIATASHVVPPELMSQPNEITVTFDGKVPYKATVAISQPDFDAAIIFAPQIVNNVAHVSLGDSDTAEIGDIVAVIGSPEGWHDTATVGRITNVHQGLGPQAPSPAWNDILFIDADILEGASGGMVIATDGLVYGLVMGVTGQFAGIGIGEHAACPSNKIKALLSQLA